MHIDILYPPRKKQLKYLQYFLHLAGSEIIPLLIYQHTANCKEQEGKTLHHPFDSIIKKSIKSSSSKALT